MNIADYRDGLLRGHRWVVVRTRDCARLAEVQLVEQEISWDDLLPDHRDDSSPTIPVRMIVVASHESAEVTWPSSHWVYEVDPVDVVLSDVCRFAKTLEIPG